MEWRVFLAKTLRLAPILLPLCGCAAILPIEEEPQPPPVAPSYEGAAYEFVPVGRGDLQSYKDISVSYMPARRESLSFSVRGELIEAVRVRLGDAVAKGDALAELNKGNLEAGLGQAEHDLKMVNMRIRHARENPDSGEQELNRLSGEREKLETRAAALRADIERRVLRAGMDGSVVYIRPWKDGDASMAGAPFIDIADKSLSVFFLGGEDAPLFPPGRKVDIKIGNEYYKAETIAPESAGIGGPKEGAYFMLEDPAANIKENSYGVVRHVFEESNNALLLPSDSVFTADGKSFVYQMGVGNVRVARDVTVGLQANGFTEILSGLEEGESVIRK